MHFLKWKYIWSINVFYEYIKHISTEFLLYCISSMEQKNLSSFFRRIRTKASLKWVVSQQFWNMKRNMWLENLLFLLYFSIWNERWISHFSFHALLQKVIDFICVEFVRKSLKVKKIICHFKILLLRFYFPNIYYVRKVL